MIWPEDWSREKRLEHAARVAWLTGKLDRPETNITAALVRWVSELADKGQRLNSLQLRADVFDRLVAETCAVRLENPPKERPLQMRLWAPWGSVEIRARAA